MGIHGSIHTSKEIHASTMPGVEETSHSEEEVSEEEAPPKKESGSEFDPEEDDGDADFEPAAKKVVKKPAKKTKKRKGADADDDSADEDWGKKKKKKAAPGAKRKNTGFTKPYKLSEALADVVGADVMPRHEVVKKLWAFIKERELQDPKNKQFIICDEQLEKVIGVKRFKAFGMMKYLKEHFLGAAEVAE